MRDSLRYYVAFNGGLTVYEDRGGGLEACGEHFPGQTVDGLAGSKTRPERVFAAVPFDGAYRSDDAGKSWKRVVEGDARCFAVDPHDDRVVYAGLGPVQLMRSEDGGDTWENLESLQQMPAEVQNQWCVPGPYVGVQFPHVCNIFIHPDDADLLLLTLEHGGVVRSEDRGKTWEDASTGIDYLDMHHIYNYPGSKDRYYVSCARGFFRSDDRGRQWRRVEDGMPWGYTEKYSYTHDWFFLPGDSPRMMVCGGRGSPGVWRGESTNPHGVILLSDDEGATWRTATNGLAEMMPYMPWTLQRHPEQPDTVFAAMGDGSRGFGFDPKDRGIGALYVTRDRGDSWEPVLAEIPSVLTACVTPQ